ncbi:MAG: AraC family transcriptional regulator [Alphaproteobacteria bacterium]|nr:AraC family transcriptional regulator [Alphaproteobacteria bacterium]
MTRPFAIDPGWAGLLPGPSVRPADLLRKAQLPEDLFARPRPVLDADDFFRLWAALSDVLGSETPGLTIGSAVTFDVFRPPLFAAFCSPDLTTAVNRLAEYKPLIGPMRLEVHDTLGGLEITVEAEDMDLPPEFIAAELVFLVQVARMALKEDIRPIAVELTKPPTHPDYETFFGRPMRAGPFDRVVFTREDARRPLLSPDPALFSGFEPDLRTRLDELDREASMADRVRAVLMEAMPSGQADAAYVARRLGVSTRSLQRRLAADGTSFKAELQSLRARLARQYLGETGHSSAEIAFLLGYEDPNSFIRAFHHWTGTTPEALRRELKQAG